MIEIHTINMGIAKSFLIRGTKDYILIDAGYKNKAKNLWSFLDKNAINPEKIKLIIITHSHVDHFGSLKEIQEKTKAKVLIQKDDLESFRQGVNAEAYPRNVIGKVMSNFSPMKKDKFETLEPDIVMEDFYSLEEYGLEGKAIHTPGHTMGSISVIIGNKAFVGDTVMGTPVNLSIKSGLPILIYDRQLLNESWEKLVNKGVKKLYLSHASL